MGLIYNIILCKISKITKLKGKRGPNFDSFQVLFYEQNNLIHVFKLTFFRT